MNYVTGCCSSGHPTIVRWQTSKNQFPCLSLNELLIFLGSLFSPIPSGSMRIFKPAIKLSPPIPLKPSSSSLTSHHQPSLSTRQTSTSRKVSPSGFQSSRRAPSSFNQLLWNYFSLLYIGILSPGSLLLLPFSTTWDSAE